MGKVGGIFNLEQIQERERKEKEQIKVYEITTYLGEEIVVELRTLEGGNTIKVKTKLNPDEHR